MRKWLTEATSQAASNLTTEAEGYVLGRGIPAPLMSDIGIGVWQAPGSRSPDSSFRGWTGALVIPTYSPRQQLVGVEFRSWVRGAAKAVKKYHLPEAAWIPTFIGLTDSAFRRIWDGGDVWIVEGVFDLALAHVVPSQDVVLASAGAALRKKHLRFLQRYVSSAACVHLVFDEDETGRKQATGFTDDRSGKWVPGVPQRLERVGVRCRDVRYRGGKDPGEVWDRGGKASLSRTFNLK